MGEGFEGIGVGRGNAGEDFGKGGEGDHRGVVAGETFFWEENVGFFRIF